MRLIDPKMSLDTIKSYIEVWDCKGCLTDGGTQHNVMAVDDLQYLPTIDAEPVRHGEWHECWYTDTVCASICTNCGKAATQARHIVGQELMTNVRYPLCPNCGARMDATDTNVGGKGGDDNG